jgi:hypothetical protein
MNGIEFVQLCRRLLQAPLPEPGTGEAWFLAAQRSVLNRIGFVEPPISDDFFHFIHHYVSDADIRRKDPEYRDSQDAAFLKRIDDYESRLLDRSK